MKLLLCNLCHIASVTPSLKVSNIVKDYVNFNDSTIVVDNVYEIVDMSTNLQTHWHIRSSIRNEVTSK